MGARIIDNRRVTLAQVINEIAPKHEHLSIATGYWDLPGLDLVFEAIKNYKTIRLLIGQEPIPPSYAPRLDLKELDSTFPQEQMIAGLSMLEHSNEMRALVSKTKELIDTGRLEVRIYRGSFLHAKTYIFGNLQSPEAIGIIGSSNFTKAGLTKNLELNAFESESRIVKFLPQIASDEHGHLSWFEEIWSSEQSENWNGKFKEILQSSPVGDRLFSPYHMYVKALYELYSDELVPDASVSKDIEQVLYDFQLRNAKLLLRKLEKNGLAMLADSVGLGKTITAGAVIRHYIEEMGSKRVYVIAPASLTYQWKEDLAKVHGLFHGFEIISMQDLARLKSARVIDKYAPVDLFVVDEAHNLRGGGGARYEELLDWFSDNLDSHVLLLTATPINNSLTDFVNQIQLASKGKLESFPVVYPTSKKTEVIDFFEAVKRLTKDINTAEKEGKKPDFDKVNRVMRQGLRHFLVRTTRAGIEREFGGITQFDGTVKKFPQSKVIPFPYQFSPSLMMEISEILESNKASFEDYSPQNLSIKWLLEQTQRAQHPLDIITESAKQDGEHPKSAFELIFQVLLLLGFAPYKTEIYKHKFYGKSSADIRMLGLDPIISFKVNSQLSIHNMLRVTFLKRLESSQFALKKSLLNYQAKLSDFEEALEKQGVVLKLSDVNRLRAEYGDDLDLSDIDFDEAEIESETADESVFNISSLKRDLFRDKQILKVLLQMCDALGKDDDKLRNFGKLIQKLRSEAPAGKKILVFSYYSDTIQYLEKEMNQYLSDSEINTIAAFTSGKAKSEIENLAKRFSPNSKAGEKEANLQGELDLLFATDVLSEGQNLQDCGMLVNFDLHWNPVRMIQRNGRINRLGSSHDSVYIYNIHPDIDLDEYLALVNRLERKIDKIRFTVGTDQSVLGESANPIEFIDDLDDAMTEGNESAVLYDPEKASAALSTMDDDEDLLSQDEFVLDLRAFERESSEEEKALVRSIPMGKWGLLTKDGSSKVDDAVALSLIRVTGEIRETSQRFTNHIFVSTTDSVGAVETIQALTAIRATKSNSSRLMDEINLDRNRIVARARQVAKTNTGTTTRFIKPTPSVTRVLDALQIQSKLSEAYESFKRVNTKQEVKEARALLDRGLRDLKTLGEIHAQTIQQFEKFIEKMKKKTVETKVVSESAVQGVLHFGR